MAIFNPNRTEGGTIKLVKDANGNYTTQEVGFNTLNSLSIPDFKTTATTTTTTDTKTATDNTGDTITSQTQMAFQMPDRDNNQIDTTGEMLQESAKKLSDSLQTVSTPTTIQDSMVRSNRLSAEQAAPQENILDTPQVKDPTERVFRSETDRFKQEFDPTRIDSTLAVDRNLKGSAAVQRGEADPPGINFDFLKGDRFKQGTTFNRPNVDQMAADAMTRQEMISGASPDDPTANQLGVSTAKPSETALDMDRFKGVSKMGTLADKDVKDVKPIKRNALETVSTSLRTTGDSILSKIKTPGMMIIDAISDAVTSPQQKNRNAFNKVYFTDRGDGRIGGNPATDVFAGMNRQSAFGDVGKSARDRIATREKTIERKGYTKDNDPTGFFAKTEEMKKQQSKYVASKQKATQGPAGGATTGGGGGSSGSDSGRVICTDLHRTGELSTRDWIRDTKFTFKTLSIKHVKGYLLWAEPTVRHIQKYPRYRKIWKHIAQHRANDIAWRLNEGKFDLLGRIYAGIGEPVCWMLGNFVSDKQISKYNLTHWRRV